MPVAAADHYGRVSFGGVPVPGASVTANQGDRHLETVTDQEGVFRQTENGRTYIFSQFEATGARLAFPCFDEPSYKVPWQLTMHVPEGLVALTNTAPERESSAGNVRTIMFARTKPLPSYLIAVVKKSGR